MIELKDEHSAFTFLSKKEMDRLIDAEKAGEDVNDVFQSMQNECCTKIPKLHEKIADSILYFLVVHFGNVEVESFFELIVLFMVAFIAGVIILIFG